MKKQSIVYIVKGSEDGNIGVYSTSIAAFKSAKAYVENSGCSAIGNLSKCRKELTAYSYYTVESSDDCSSADIERFYLN